MRRSPNHGAPPPEPQSAADHLYTQYTMSPPVILRAERSGAGELVGVEAGRGVGAWALLWRGGGWWACGWRRMCWDGSRQVVCVWAGEGYRVGVAGSGVRFAV